MDEKQLQFLYENYGKSMLFTDYNEFKSLMSNDENRKLFFNESNSDLGFTDYDEFESILGVKKKDPSQQDSKEPVQPSGQNFDIEFQRKAVVSHFDKLVEKGITTPSQKERKLRFIPQEEQENIPYSVRQKAIKGSEQLSKTPVLDETPIVGEKGKELDAAIKQVDRSNEYSKLKTAAQEFEQYGTKNYEGADISGSINRYNEAKNEYQKTGENKDALINSEQELEKNLSVLDRDYINITLSKGNPQHWTEIADKYDKVQQKKQEGKPLSDAEKEFLFDTRQNALGGLAASERVKIMEVEDAVDINTFNKEMALLGSEKTPEAYNERLSKIIQKTGIDQGVLTDLNDRYIKLAELQKASAASENENSNIAYEGDLEQQRKQQRKTDGNMVSEFGRGIVGSMGTMLLKMAELPKTMGLGESGKYDITDEIYDSIESTVKGAQGTWGALDNAPDYLKYSYGLGQGVGSVAMFAAGGGSANLAKIPQAVGTMGTAYLLSQPDNYTDAINSGLDETNARIVSNLISIVEGAAEGIVDDPKIFAQTLKKTVFSEFKKGKNIKEAVKLAMKQMPDSFAQISKGGFEEGSEELIQQLFGDLTKESVNTVAGKDYFQNTFDSDSYKEAFLTGAMTGGFMKVFGSAEKKSPETVQAMRDAVDMRTAIVSNIAATNPELSVQVGQVLDKAAEAKTGLESHSQWNNLTTEAQNKALSLVWQMELAEDSRKAIEKFGIKDEQGDKQIKELAKELDGIFKNDENTKAYRDATILQLQTAREKLGVKYDPMSDAPKNAGSVFERVQNGVPTDPVAVKELSDWLYSKYKELSDMKNDDKRMLTINQIEEIQQQLGDDIGVLEDYRNENDSTVDKTADEKLVDDMIAKQKSKSTETTTEKVDSNTREVLEEIKAGEDGIVNKEGIKETVKEDGKTEGEQRADNVSQGGTGGSTQQTSGADGDLAVPKVQEGAEKKKLIDAVNSFAPKSIGGMAWQEGLSNPETFDATVQEIREQAVNNEDQVRKVIGDEAADIVLGKSKPDPLKDVESTAKALEGVDVPVSFTESKPKPIDESSIAESNKWINNLFDLKDGTKIKDTNGNIYQISNGTLRKLKLNENGEVVDSEVVYRDSRRSKNPYSNPDFFNSGYFIIDNNSNKISESYHKAKADGSNPELVKAVEELLGSQKPSVQETGTGVSGEQETQETLQAAPDTERKTENINTTAEQNESKKEEKIDTTSEQVDQTDTNEKPKSKGDKLRLKKKEEKIEKDELGLWSAVGEKRKAGRGKRIEKDNKYKEKLNSFNKEYSSVNVERTTAIVDDYYNENVATSANKKEALDFAKELISEDVAAGLGDNKHVFTKSAFAVLLVQKILAEAQMAGDLDLATEANDILDTVGRVSGLKLALLQSRISLDALGSFAIAEAQKQEKVGKEVVGSGRTKKTVVAEIKAERDNAMKEVSDDVADNLDVTTTISQAPQTPKPQSRKQSSKKAEIERKRKEAINRVKIAFSDSGAGGGLLMAASPKNKERAAAIVNLAKVEIEAGIYTAGEIISKVAKDLQGIVSKEMVNEAVLSEWEELSKLSNEARRTEATELIKDAIEGRSSDKAIKALAKALKIADPEYIKAMGKGKKLTPSQILSEVLKDPDKTAELIEMAVGKLIAEVNEGQHLDIVQVSKPKNLSDSEWEAVKKKYVIAKFRQFANSFVQTEVDKLNQSEREKQLSKNEAEKERFHNAWLKAKDKRDAAREKAEKKFEDKEKQKLAEKELQEAEANLKAAEDAWNKRVNDAVKKVVKDFYQNPNSNQTFLEALIEAMPELTMEQAKIIADKVIYEMNKRIDARDNRRIKDLIHEMTDNKEDSSVMDVMRKIFGNRGAIGQFGFTNLLSSYLGYKGIPPQVIAQIQSFAQLAAKTQSPAIRTALIQKANSLAATYSDTVWNLIYNTLTEIMVRNILSPIKTLFTGGFSVGLSSIPALIKKVFINRPSATFRSIAFTASNLFGGRWGVRNALAETMLRNNDALAYITGQSENLYAKDRDWQKIRKASWKEINQVWKSDPKKAIAIAAMKILQEGTFQGKIPVANIVSNSMAFMNFISFKIMQDMNLAYMAQNELIMKGIKPSDPSYKQEFLNTLGTSPKTLAAIEQQVKNEIQTSIQNGTPIPKGYKKTRTAQLIKENTDEKIYERASEQAIYDNALNIPRSLIGSLVYSGLSTRIKPEIEGQMSFSQMTANLIMTSLGLFSKTAIVLAERGVKSIPGLGTATGVLWPARYTVKDGKSQRIMIDGEPYNIYSSENRKELAYQLAVASAIGFVLKHILGDWWDEEELLDKDGNPIKDPKTGEPIIVSRYLMGDKVDFYGSSAEFDSGVRGTDPKNVIITYGEDGKISKTIPFTSLPPELYGMAMALGARRDKERYGTDKIIQRMDELKNPETMYKELDSKSDIDFFSFTSSAMANSGNFDFQTISRIINASIKGNKTGEEIFTTVADALLINPAKSTVSPRIVNSIEEQFYNINGMYKTYVKLEPNIQSLGTYLMKDIWFTDPFMPNRKAYESVDVFGNKIAYPPIFHDFIGSFGATTNYAMADHVEKHKDQYAIFFDGKTPEDRRIPFPKRYVYTPSKKDDPSISEGEKADKNIQRTIADMAYENFGKLVNESREELLKVPYSDRKFFIDYIYDIAVYESITSVYKNSSRDFPKVPSAVRSYKSSDKFKEESIIESLSN